MPVSDNNERPKITISKEDYETAKLLAEIDQRSFANWVAVLISREIKKKRDEGVIK